LSSSNDRFRTREILITGASSGIGKALAIHYASTGVKLILVGRNKDRLQQVAKEVTYKGAEAEYFQQDIRDQVKIRELILAHPDLDMIFVNAGISIGGLSPESNEYEAASRNIFETNLTGAINCIHPAIDVMRSKSQSPSKEKVIAVICSLAGYRGLPSSPAYSASKAGLKAYCEGLIPHAARMGIQLSVINPGFVESGITDKNNFTMPFFMPASKAAEIISDAISKRKTSISFPWQMRFLCGLVRALPTSLALRLLGRTKAQKG
ncbi:MAG: SDR family NAD(P)-dependent oxidoreductase, partial [Alphaproteobacteria bacterium]|nr:SDR family NAD(P)-dependent oxidoreductase [Alphaproteobacteria bacterium]